jgi:hypothetical protein
MTRKIKSSYTAGARVVGVAVLAASALGLGTLPAQAADKQAPKEQPAIVGPLLQIFTFGADVGVPTGCQAASAGIGTGAAYFGVAQQAVPVIAGINSGCTMAQAQADTYIAMGNAQDGPLAAWNPMVNPVIQMTADSVTQAGTDYGPAVAPFGPTIAGLGATLNFFQGH